ncbi:ATP-binding protein [Pontibacter silvestris]|uniref:histidine kinase n=1 Tax=Pontibacter silvestris TaxID=2305183 RepID=A0ABW4X249_9BACT|nr:ATP-binding protein [Pontibacter silvestris]MCC9135787.1 PAS domain S-box protein [Pontibacter silvestris]
MPTSNTDIVSLQFLANNTKQAIFVYEVEHNQFTYLNPAFEAAFKIIKEEAIDADALLRMVHTEDQQYVIEMYQRLLNEKSSKEIEFRITLPEQEERWICLTSFLMNDTPEKEHIVGYLEDVTASKQYNDYLKKFGNKKDSVLHILTHDLSGPIGIVQSLSEILAEEAKQYNNQQIDRLIGVIERTNAYATSLIQSFINHEFLEATGVDLIKRRVNIVERFEEIIEQYRQSEAEIAKTFQFFTSSRNIFIELDDVKFIQAVNNLISNAIKFTPDGGIITVSLEERQQHVLVKVEDNGVGIPKKYHATLFDKFTNARRPGLKGESSIGLGMSIVKTIVEWHQGQIWFESEEGKGTTFYIEVPKE